MKTAIIDIETTGLDPTKEDLVCIGAMDTNTGKSIVFFDDESEEAILENFLSWFHRNQFDTIVGFNLPFDYRFLIAKMLKYKMPANGLLSARHVDLMQILKSGGKGNYNLNKPGTLEDWSQFLFNEGKIPLPDSIANLSKARRLHEIMRYCKSDVELTYKLWKRIEEVLWKS